jgi:hypothetical protein
VSSFGGDQFKETSARERCGGSWVHMGGSARGQAEGENQPQKLTRRGK